MRRDYTRITIGSLLAVFALLGARAHDASGGAFTLNVRTDGSDTLCTGYVDAPATNAPDCALATLEAALPLAPDGGRITIGAGAYTPGALSRGAGVTIQGKAGTRPVLVLPATVTWFTCLVGAKCTFANLVLEANLENAIVRGVRVQGDATFQQVAFNNFAGSAITVDGPATATIEDSVFEHAQTGVAATDGGAAEVTASTFADGTTGVYASGASATVTGNDFRSMGVGVRSFAPTLSPVPTSVTVDENNFEDVGMPLWDTSNASTGTSVQAHFNRLSGKVVFGTANASGDITNNWWGCNSGPGLDPSAPRCVILTNPSPVAHEPWLVMTPAIPYATRKTTTIGVSFRLNSSGSSVSTPTPIPNGIPVAFAATPSSLASVAASTAVSNGKAATALAIGAADGRVSVTATLDDQRLTRIVRVDRRSPSTRIMAPKDHARPDAILRVRGTASDPTPTSGIDLVQVAVMRKGPGKCEFWTRMVWQQSPCGKRTWLLAGGRGHWLVGLPPNAAGVPRRYWIYSRAIDRAGNASKAGFTRGENLVVVDVQ